MPILFHVQSFMIVALMTVGLYNRKKRAKHITLMLTAIFWDFCLILQIELSRSAIKKAMDFSKHHFMLDVHLVLAISTVVLYVIMIYTGISIHKRHKKSFVPYHRSMGILTYLLRLATLVTSFWATMG